MQAHSKHKTAILAIPINASEPSLAPFDFAIKIGVAATASNTINTGMALGRAKLSVQPIHLIRLGTIGLGSSLQQYNPPL
jgi:hypothetical protein